MLINLRPDTLIITDQDSIPDDIFNIEIDAIVRKSNGQAVENVPVQFENLFPEPGTLLNSVVYSNSSGVSTAQISVGEGEILTKD